jgi:N-acyl-L-homoserine lactone synthetase
MRHRRLAGEGVDEFDPKRPTYILVTPSRHVVGYACLLPATGPTMILVLFPISSGPGLLLPHAAMVESSRFCAYTSLEAGRAGGLLHTT